jgi:hypothetical protein
MGCGLCRQQNDAKVEAFKDGKECPFNENGKFSLNSEFWASLSDKLLLRDIG